MSILGGFCLGYLIAENQFKKKFPVEVSAIYRIA